MRKSFTELMRVILSDAIFQLAPALYIIVLKFSCLMVFVLSAKRIRCPDAHVNQLQFTSLLAQAFYVTDVYIFFKS